MRRKTVLVFACALLCWMGTIAAEDVCWQPRLEMAQKQWLPGEPITAYLTVENVCIEAPLFRLESLYFDSSDEPCMDRAMGVVTMPPPAPPGTEGSAVEPKRYPAGTFREFELRISRICNIEVGDSEKLYGQHTFCHRSPEDEGSVCTVFEIIRPSGVDREVFEAFPEKMRDIVTDSSMLKLDIVETYRTSTYAGYALAKGYGALPFSKPPEQTLIEALGSGEFLQEHPEITMFLDRPRIVDDRLVRRETVRTEPRIRAHMKLLSEFIELHPEFFLRHRLEMMLGLDSLALGEADASASHWRWVVEHSPEGQFVERAQSNLQELDDHGFVAPVEGSNPKCGVTRE